MENDPELNPKYLGSISSDFVKVAEWIKEASYQIRKREFSEYPIFPASKEDIPLGQLLYEKDQFGNQWNYFASFLEEFMDRKLIEDRDQFEKAYRDPDEFCCLFIVDKDFTNFIFIPYPED